MGEGSENLVEVDRQNREGRDWGTEKDRKKDGENKEKDQLGTQGNERKRGWGSKRSFYTPPRAPPTPGD